MIELLAGGLLERHDVHALGIDPGHNVLDRGVLAGRVHRLEDDQQGVDIARPQELLRILQPLDALSQHVRGGAIQLRGRQRVVHATTRPAGVASDEVRFRPRFDAELVGDPFG